MTRRFLFLGLAAAVMALGGMTAQAGQVTLTPLATRDLGNLEPSGNFVIEGNLKFSDFTYSAIDVSTKDTVPPPASAVQVLDFTANPPGEPGISFQAGFNAPAGSTYDFKIGYTVTALSGTISGAFLSITGGTNQGTGTVSAGETLAFAGRGTTLEATIPGSPVSQVSFDPQSVIRVTKDILVTGGSSGASVSVINQAFRSVAIPEPPSGSVTTPEPTSMALLGIGLSGLFTFRRFLKRALAA